MHIFISYARADTEFVNQLKRRLKESQFYAWADIDNVRAGQSWQQAIDDALRSAAKLVVVVSPASAESPYVTYEWSFALGARIEVIPLLLSETEGVHPRLASLQYVDFTRPGKRWLRLIDALQHGRSRGGAGKKPVVRARFELKDGKPLQENDHYVIWLSVANAPTDASRVRYELHDPSFKDPRWSEKNPEQGFSSRIESSGDVLVSADLETPATKIHTETTLFQALWRTHGRSRNKPVLRALREIEEN